MSVIRQGGLVFDIGAHKGESAESFLKAGAGQVVCVEAGFEFAREISCRGFTGVTVVHAACGEIAGELVSWHRATKDDGRSTIGIERWREVYKDEIFMPSETVATVTLDQLKNAFGQPDYVKIDVEGQELAVLGGMYTCDPSFITFEFHGADEKSFRNCASLLSLLGYTKQIMMASDVDTRLMPVNPIADLLTCDLPVWGNVTVGR